MNLFVTLFSVILFACTSQDQEVAQLASIASVEVTGTEQNYTFSVGISSPDEGCEQYADWWEVINEGGELIYRRILGHSHVNEQPFVRSGGKVNISKGQLVIVRAHMNNLGYGEIVFKGSVEGGITKTKLNKTFAQELSSKEPLPQNCAF